MIKRVKNYRRVFLWGRWLFYLLSHGSCCCRYKGVYRRQSQGGHAATVAPKTRATLAAAQLNQPSCHYQLEVARAKQAPCVHEAVKRTRLPAAPCTPATAAILDPLPRMMGLFLFAAPLQPFKSLPPSVVTLVATFCLKKTTFLFLAASEEAKSIYLGFFLFSQVKISRFD